ncbi:MAG: membrane integrity-associated transporter subunit PqiC [Proteobacteria bacterium]|nr:membrane integrity-associated transporter subunit PqiC [Pseudomonadota bacterium]
MNRRLILAFIAPLCLILTLSGCLSGEQGYPEKRFFALEAMRPDRVPPPAAGPVLKVRPFRVSPQYEAKGFVYRTGDSSYASDFYNEFFIPPGPMLTDQTIKWLAAAGLFGRVTDDPGRQRPDYVLEGALNLLYADFRNSQAPRVVLEFKIFLLSDRTAEPGVVFQKSYRRETPVGKGSGPEALVGAWNQGLAGLLADLEADLKGLDLSRGR